MTTTGDKAVFARFCLDHKIDPQDLANLITLGKRSKTAGEREVSIDDENVRIAAQKAHTRFEEAA